MEFIPLSHDWRTNCSKLILISSSLILDLVRTDQSGLGETPVL